MALLYFDPKFLEHDTGSHPESAVRLEHIMARLNNGGLTARCRRPAWEPAGQELLSAVHSADYLTHLASLASCGGGRLDGDTVMSAASWDVARLAAGATCDAVARVVGGEDSTALCLVRPPGHHALAERAMGFCLLGNVALAAQAALDVHGLERVLVVDWDVHHGNGTQDIFYDDPRVGFFSTHRWPFYPGTGARDETGVGDGLGYTHNVPLPFGMARQEQLKRFAGELSEFAARVRPQLVLVSAGFDSHAADPIGSLGLETEDFVDLTRSVRAIAEDYASGRLVSVLEGGYNPPVLADCVAAHLEGLQ